MLFILFYGTKESRQIAENKTSLENALQLSKLDDLMSLQVTIDFTTSQYNDSPSIVAANHWECSAPMTREDSVRLTPLHFNQPLPG